MTPEEVAAYKAAHAPDEQEMCVTCRFGDGSFVCWPCLPFRLAEHAQQQAEALAASEAKVAQAAEIAHSWHGIARDRRDRAAAAAVLRARADPVVLAETYEDGTPL